MNREIHVRICEGLGEQSPGLLDPSSPAPLFFRMKIFQTILNTLWEEGVSLSGSSDKLDFEHDGQD